MEIVDHQEASAVQKLTKLFGLIVGKQPVPHLDPVEHGPVVDFIRAVEAHHLLHGACVDARQTANARKQMPVRAWIIHGPITREVSVVAVVRVPGDIRIAQARAGPLSRFVPVGRLRKILVLDGGIFLEGPLRPKDTPG